MANYIDGFVLPIPKEHLDTYRTVAKTVASIWKEHGALAYYEFVGDDMKLEGTRSFPDCTNATSHEVIIFGWVAFESRDHRDLVNKRVASDPRMHDLIAPLTQASQLIFNAERMIYGGFKTLVD